MGEDFDALAEKLLQERVSEPISTLWIYQGIAHCHAVGRMPINLLAMAYFVHLRHFYYIFGQTNISITITAIDDEVTAIERFCINVMVGRY